MALRATLFNQEDSGDSARLRSFRRDDHRSSRPKGNPDHCCLSIDVGEILLNTVADDDYTVLAPTLTLGLMRRAQSLPCEAIHTHGMDLDVDELDFCKRFVTTAENFLSYSRWSRQHTLEALPRLRVPVTVIVGSADQRMDAPWIQALEASGLGLILIDAGRAGAAQAGSGRVERVGCPA